jgi:hypothetical protein
MADEYDIYSGLHINLMYCGLNEPRSSGNFNCSRRYTHLCLATVSNFMNPFPLFGLLHSLLYHWLHEAEPDSLYEIKFCCEALCSWRCYHREPDTRVTPFRNDNVARCERTAVRSTHGLKARPLYIKQWTCRDRGNIPYFYSGGACFESSKDYKQPWTMFT